MVGQLVNRLCWVVEVELLRFHQLAQSNFSGPGAIAGPGPIKIKLNHVEQRRQD